MKDTYYLIVNQGGVSKIVHRRPVQLKAGEFAIEQTIEIPDEAFLPVIIPKTKLSISAELTLEQLFNEAGHKVPPGAWIIYDGDMKIFTKERCERNRNIILVSEYKLTTIKTLHNVKMHVWAEYDREEATDYELCVPLNDLPARHAVNILPEPIKTYYKIKYQGSTQERRRPE